ncbi:unnamed protein product [Ambrosiozyma monospora]|uniref:Unnamed protein product n=1 Tax=Ambrosiozyma monospora TaxID=43982 RepID=A0ACB5UAH9_AMBMO|nr:unnamed protein product [Ambrosiozyma monospora]
MDIDSDDVSHASKQLTSSLEEAQRASKSPEPAKSLLNHAKSVTINSPIATLPSSPGIPVPVPAKKGKRVSISEPDTADPIEVISETLRSPQSTLSKKQVISMMKYIPVSPKKPASPHKGNAKGSSKAIATRHDDISADVDQKNILPPNFYSTSR